MDAHDAQFPERTPDLADLPNARRASTPSEPRSPTYPMTNSNLGTNAMITQHPPCHALARFAALRRLLPAALAACAALALAPDSDAHPQAGSPQPANGAARSPAVQAFEILSDGFRLASPTTEITIQRGAITRIVNRLTGEVHANGGANSPYMPRGIMCAAGGYAGIRLLHGEWTSHPLYSGQLATSIASLDRSPGNITTMNCVALPQGGRATWTNLTCGNAQYPNDTLVIEALVDPATGIIDITANATSQAHDVVGVMVPIVNLHTRHSIYVASFGGMVYTPADLASNQMRVLHSAPFLEAPVLVAEGDTGSIGLWMEDQTFKPYVAFFGGDATNTSMGLEAVNKMPFEGKRAAQPGKWRVGAFRGTWPNAMAPYRDWYARTFASEIAMRNAIAWPAGISVIVDKIGANQVQQLDRLQKLLTPSSVLLHDWYARQPDFDAALPDWTPRSSFINLVNAARSRSIKTMGYVNTYCVNYQSPVFQRDGIASFALPRKVNSLSAYGQPLRTFASFAPNQLIYLDPLSPQWRTYHTNQMITWRQQTGADANYEDTGGTAGDFGNGEVGGLYGAQGGWAQFRDLLQRNPVPMGTEFAPDNMAFASTWAMRHSQVWGEESTRRLWETRHRPISPMLFGGAARAWVPTTDAESEQRKWTVVACSDALGGVAQLEATDVSFQARAGLARHMVERAQIFSRLALKPDFTTWPKDPTVVAQYRASTGTLYQYRVRGNIQELVTTSGQPLYQRVTNEMSVDSPLRIAGWPAWNGTRSIGLQPSARYALGVDTTATTAVQIDRCPTGSSIARYTESPDFALVVFANSTAPSSARSDSTLGVIARTEFVDVIVRAENGTVQRRNARLAAGQRMDVVMQRPREMLFLRRMPDAPAVNQSLGMVAAGGKFVIDGAGIERGGTYTPPHQAGFRLSGQSTTTPFRFSSYGGDSEVLYERLIRVPNATTSLSVTYRNAQQQHGNGAIVRISVNGRVAHSRDLGPAPGATGASAWNTDAQTVRVPLGAHAGLPVVVGVSVWGKGDDNADEIWITEPILVNDTTQQVAQTSTAVLP
jgi:hypothetical protein